MFANKVKDVKSPSPQRARRTPMSKLVWGTERKSSLRQGEQY
jgi:hypothetical protein